MKDEIAATVFFIMCLVKRQDKLSEQQIEKFASKLMMALLKKYKVHWYPESPLKGQAYRCIRINQFQSRDPLLEQACVESHVDFDSLGLPKEMTIWVDPFHVSCRFGEETPPFTVASFEGNEKDHTISQSIRQAVAKALSPGYHITCTSEESCNSEPKSIPTVSNPNSIYQVRNLEQIQLWSQYPRRKAHTADMLYQHPGSTYCLQHSGYKGCQASSAFGTSRLDRYHWVNPNR
uniref:BTG anti-proliferation factor 4 n=1 Tax=Salvator merianae TaxID=96440 RepID=A0A8D0EAI1_SALMN